MVEVSRVGDIAAQLGECPVWNVEEQMLYWEDIEAKVIHRTDPNTETTISRDLPGRPGSFVFSQTPGRLLVASETSLQWLDWESGEVDEFVQAEDSDRGNRLNDGRCDHAGRYIVGTMHPDSDARRFDGSLYSISPEGNVDVLETDVGVPNSTVFDRERNHMYWADTFDGTIWRWDYDLETGRRSNKLLFFDYRSRTDVPGLPDGACLDAEGCIWSASVTGWAVTRFTPDGEVDRRIELPVSMPTMPAFGGPDLATLYVTSLTGGPVDEKRSGGVPPGSLLALDVGVAGLPEPKFGK